MSGSDLKTKILYVLLCILLLLVGSVLLSTSDEVIIRLYKLVPLIGTYLSMIFGVALITLAAYIYMVKPENGKDGWGVISVGCILIVISFVKSAKITSEGIELDRGESPVDRVALYYSEQSKINSKQLLMIDNLKEQLGNVKSDLSELKKVPTLQIVTSQSLINKISKVDVAETDLEHTVDKLVERADVAPTLLLSVIDEALTSKKLLPLSSWKKLLNASANRTEIKVGYMARLPKVIEKLKAVTGASDFSVKLTSQFHAYIESDEPYRAGDTAHIKILFDAADDIIVPNFPSSKGQHRLYYEYVRSYGISQKSYKEVQKGDLLMVSPENWMAPLRDDMPGFFGAKADEIKWDSRKVLLKVLEKKKTSVIGALWLHVEIVYTDDNKKGPRMNSDGYIAWFDYRFVYVVPD